MGSHYNSEYFTWQNRTAVWGADADRWKFDGYSDPSYTVLDWGCGGGFELENLPAKERWGVDINPAARAEANSRIVAVESIADLPSGLMFDLIISNHALEHVTDPFSVLCELRKRLKSDGTIVFVTPLDKRSGKWNPQKADINQHLYTWTPLLLGNLFTLAGYRVIAVELFAHTWFPMSKRLHRYLPRAFFDFGCSAWGILSGTRQLRIVARRE